MEITFEINRDDVYQEVAQTTSYTGAKMDEDPNAYDRIYTTDEDSSQLDRFWDESCTAVCEMMRKYLVSDDEQSSATGRVHRFMMDFSRSFDEALVPSMRKDLFSFFVMNITAKWYGFTNKKEAGGYGEAAAGLLEGIHRKACYKLKPVRPRFN